MLISAFDAVWYSATLSSPDDRIAIVWEASVKWRLAHDLEFAELLEQVGKGAAGSGPQFAAEEATTHA